MSGNLERRSGARCEKQIHEPARTEATTPFLPTVDRHDSQIHTEADCTASR